MHTGRDSATGRASQPCLYLVVLTCHGMARLSMHPPMFAPSMLRQRGGAPARKAQCARARTRLSIEGPFPTENFPILYYYTHQIIHGHRRRVHLATHCDFFSEIFVRKVFETNFNFRYQCVKKSEKIRSYCYLSF